MHDDKPGFPGPNQSEAQEKKREIATEIRLYKALRKLVADVKAYRRRYRRNDIEWESLGHAENLLDRYEIALVEADDA